MGKQTSENVIGIICKRQDWLARVENGTMANN